eukprot:m.17988 g.17988  ORF g.17988 m.17988 type:complete len:97 (-) comp5598_c0_seq1:19-309(-)
MLFPEFELSLRCPAFCERRHECYLLLKKGHVCIALRRWRPLCPSNPFARVGWLTLCRVSLLLRVVVSVPVVVVFSPTPSGKMLCGLFCCLAIDAEP